MMAVVILWHHPTAFLELNERAQKLGPGANKFVGTECVAVRFDLVIETAN